MNELEIEKLAIALANAKSVESEAKIARIKAEEALADAVGGRENGSTSVKVGRFGITVKRGWNYKIENPEAFAEKFPNFVKYTEKIDVYSRAYEDERAKNTNLFFEMAEYVTATPKKVSVELKL